MRRKHWVLLASLAGLLLLTAAIRAIEGSDHRGAAVPVVHDSLPRGVRPPAVVASSVASTDITSISVTDINEPLDNAPAPTGSDPEATVTVAAWTKRGCADSGHSAVIDRVQQRTWLCDAGHVTSEFVMTSAYSQPSRGTYTVYAKDLEASSMFTGKYSTMTHFVAFAKGRNTGARIAFHSIPKYSDGKYVQPLDSVGTAAKRGASSGCIRVLYDDSVEIWNWLAIGDPVIVIS